MSEFSHIDGEGRVRMVDVTQKPPTARLATARGKITTTRETFQKIVEQAVDKGNVFETARIAGVMAAKRTADLIPMCHPLTISHVQLDFFPDAETCSIAIQAEVKLVGNTGVEMEALTAVSVAALTIYDMCKAHDREMVISDILLQKKSGGKSGTFDRA